MGVAMFERILVILFIVIQSFSLAFGAESPKYIFLMIGDGMGSAQRQAADFYYRSCQIRDGSEPQAAKPLEMNGLPVTGLTSSFSVDAVVTDSAAAATSLATGEKTRNGVLSLDQTRRKKLTTLAEIAKQQGRKVGIISNVWINHATPAAFYSHKPSREMYYEIAVDLAGSDMDYFAGGFAHDIEKKKLRNRPDPVKLAVDNGFTIAVGSEQLNALKPGVDKVWAYDVDMDVLDYEIDRRDGRLCLNDFVKKGIELLYEDNPKGFFMMIEGGKIDWACHANDAATAIKDVVDFNESVKTVLEFYKNHPGETLIVITGDHECGGMKLSSGCMKYDILADTIESQTGSDVQFVQLTNKCHDENMDFAASQKLIMDFFNWESLNGNEIRRIKNAYDNDGYVNDGDFDYGNKHKTMIACTHVLSERAGITWTGYSHTGVPVMTTAIGCGQDLFSGIYDNTDLSNKIRTLMQADLNDIKKSD
jgi:alkaline phosphatase